TVAVEDVGLREARAAELDQDLFDEVLDLLDRRAAPVGIGRASMAAAQLELDEVGGLPRQRVVALADRVLRGAHGARDLGLVEGDLAAVALLHPAQACRRRGTRGRAHGPSSFGAACSFALFSIGSSASRNCEISLNSR